jgi:hypothetical protein
MEGPVDKLDIRISGGTKLMRVVERELLASNSSYAYGSPNFNSGAPKIPIRGTRYYKRIHDLRFYGLSSILHFGNRFNGDHKLEIVGTGTMPLSEIVSEIERVFDVDPMEVKIMRIDLAVDVTGYPVDWFRQNARVPRKRHTSEFDRWVGERKRVETLYFGKRPNIFRIYDKTAERRVEYQRLHSRWNVGEPIATFEERYGQPEDQILTRVERQYGGGRVPKPIGTLGQLHQSANEFNPYEPLQFLPITISEEFVNELSGDAYVRGQGVLRLLERHGYHEAKRLLDEKSRRNTHRLLEQLTRSISSDRTSKPPDLFAMYKEAIIRQLTA